MIIPVFLSYMKIFAFEKKSHITINGYVAFTDLYRLYYFLS